MSKLVLVAAVAATLTGAAYAQHSQTTGAAQEAQSQTLATLPPGVSSVTNWYKQDVYDPSENKIGEISDVLVDKDGKISALMVSVGGFLGMGERYVAVSPASVNIRHDDKNDKWLASMNTTKEALKAAPEFKYPK